MIYTEINNARKAAKKAGLSGLYSFDNPAWVTLNRVKLTLKGAGGRVYIHITSTVFQEYSGLDREGGNFRIKYLLNVLRECRRLNFFLYLKYSRTSGILRIKSHCTPKLSVKLKTDIKEIKIPRLRLPV